jgi:hypothetical protein
MAGTDRSFPHATVNSPGDAGVKGIRVGESENGRTLTLHPGQVLAVKFGSTFWTFKGSSNPRVLAQLGPAVVAQTQFNKSTCPYGGCGTVTARFRAVRSGTAQVSAIRTSCGEAMGCTGAAGLYHLTVVVRAQRPLHSPERHRSATA